MALGERGGEVFAVLQFRSDSRNAPPELETYMNKAPKSTRYERNSDAYLRQTEKEFFISHFSGLYQPKAIDDKHEIKVKMDASLASLSDTRHRPLSSFQDLFANFISAISLLIALFTLIGLAYTVYWAKRQWEAMDQSLKQTQNQTKIADESLAETRKTIQQTRDFFMQDQRAWLGVDAEHIPKIVPRGKDHILTIPFRNTGKTPALRQVICIKSGRGLDEVKSCDSEPSPLDSRGVIMPGSQFVGSISIENSVMEQLTNYKNPDNGITNLVVFGKVRYEDIFGYHHWTQFCLYVQPTPGQYILCPKYNTTEPRNGKVAE
jgi:hypothetical protein